MSNPRTPEHFPRMKVRGARRRKLAPYQRLAGAMMLLGKGANRAAYNMRAFAEAINQ